MEYRLLGNSGLKVSVLGFGAMTFKTLEQSIELLRAAREGGINFYDNAEVYGKPPGSAEVLFGKALKVLQKEDPVLYRRSDLVITTKIFMGPQNKTIRGDHITEFQRKMGVNELGTCRKHLMEGIKDSLKRLQLDYVDVIFAHRYDGTTPMVETVRAFTDIIKSGKAFYWGTSTWPETKIIEAYWVAKMNNLIPPIVEQPLYNMLNREFMEDDYLDLFEYPYRIGTTIYSPLAGGILSGKYNDGNIPSDSRLADKRMRDYFIHDKNDENIRKLKELGKICNENGWHMVSLANAWTLKNKNVSVCLFGASKVSQMAANLKSIEVAMKLDKNLMKRIEKILKNKPLRNKRTKMVYRTIQSKL